MVSSYHLCKKSLYLRFNTIYVASMSRPKASKTMIEGLNDLKANEVPLPDSTSLFEDVHRKTGSRKSPNLLSLPGDCSLLTYYTSRGEQRNAPSGLCRLTYTTDHPAVRAFHSKTIKAPFVRRKEIQFVVDKYLRNCSSILSAFCSKNAFKCRLNHRY